MNGPIQFEPPASESTQSLPADAVELLQRIHALAAAGTAIAHDLGDSAWPPAAVALWQQDLLRLNQRCETAEQQACESGVPRELVTMAWYAGHCDTEWTPAPDDATAGLRPVLGAELMAGAGQLHNMAAVLVSHELHPGSRVAREPLKAEQLTRNMAAMFKQTAMLSNLIGVSDSGWESLWDLPHSAQREYLTAFLGSDVQQDLEWAWNQYTATDVETTVLHSIDQLAHRTQEHHHPDPSDPRPDRGVEHTIAAATRVYRNTVRHLHEHLATGTSTSAGGAVDAALPEHTDRVWEPRDNTPGGTDPAEDSTAPELEP